MPAVGIYAIVVSGLIVAALAFYLIRVVIILHHVTDTLGKVTFGVRAIAHRVEPVGPVVTDINTNLLAVAGALEALVEKLNEPAEAI